MKRYFLMILVILFLGLDVTSLWSVQVTSNGIYDISIDDISAIGVFTVSTGSNHPSPHQNVLYGGAGHSPWSSYLTIQSYTTKTTYVSTDSSPSVPSGFTLKNMHSYSPVISNLINGFRTVWNINDPDMLEVVQETIIHGTEYEDSYVEVTTTVTNTGSSTVSIGIRYQWDWMIDGSDDSWFATREPDGDWTDVFIGFDNPAFNFYEEVNDPSSPMFSVYGTVNGPANILPAPTPPDFVSYVAWPIAYNSAWDFPISGSGTDSAVCYFWGYPEANAITLQPGESYTVHEHLGTFSFSEIHLGISPPTLPDIIAGLPYYQDLSVEGGEPPYTWEIESGQLPPGLEMDTLTGEITGIVTTGGTYDFVVGVTDSSDPPAHQSQGYTINADTPPYVPVERTGGKLLYVKDITRDTDGNIIQTGNLYIKDIETREEKPLTNYTGNFIIRNPSFSYNGSQIIYTSNVSGIWKIYLISLEGIVSSSDEGVVCENGYSHPYAALSPDGRFIAFVQEYNGRTQLWYYDFQDRNYTLLKDDKNLQIKDIVFIDTTRIAFIGVRNGIQDIYRIHMNGTEIVNLTNNTPTTPQYGRLVSTWRYRDDITFFDHIHNTTYYLTELLYSKRNWAHFNYGKWDIYSFNVDFGTEVNLTDTPDIDEYDPCFGNIADLWRGDVFYSASILAGPDVWRANYEWYDWYTVSNSLKDQWTGTTSTTENTGMIDFIPSTFFGISEKIITIPETRFFYIDGGDIYRGDYDENTSNWNLIQPITTPATRAEISGAKNGGVIAYTGGISPTYITKLNHDGTGEGIFASDTVNLRNSFVSADGRWIIYVKEESGGTYGIYGKLTSGGAEQTILSGVAGRIGEVALNDDMTKVVYSKEEVSGKYDIYIRDIITTATTITGSGTPVNLTNSVNADDRFPSFSPDGQLIIFVSDIWDNTSRIFTMDMNGNGLTLVVGDEDGNPVNPAWPFFGPVNYDESNYYISYISDNPAAGTRTIKVASFPETDPTPDDGENLATLLYDTEISPSDDKYVWVVKREKGTIVGERKIPERIGSDLNFTYQIVIDTDEASLPSSFTLNEILPNTFNINSIFIDGILIPATNYSVFNNSPYSGLQTLKILFYSGYNYGIKDHLIEITVKSPSTTGNYSISGDIKYLLNGTFNREENISGSGKISVFPPFMPVDIYDPDDNAPDSSGNRVSNGNTQEPNGIIDDYDLLYAIDCWTIDAQLSGYGPGWPENISNWDNIILAVIDIWSSQGKKGYYDPTGGGANTQVNNRQTEPGEYVFIGDKDSPGDNLPEIYAPDGATPGYPEMYWTQGEWANP